jgi:hypothetical protein
MVGFKDYVTIAEAFEEAQLDEGKIWDAIIKKLSGKGITGAEAEAEATRLLGDKEDLGKKKNANIEKIKKTKQSQEFQKRKQDRETASARQARASFGSRGTVGTGDEEQESAQQKADRLFVQNKSARAQNAMMRRRDFGGHDIQTEELLSDVTEAGWYVTDTEGAVIAGPAQSANDLDSKFKNDSKVHIVQVKPEDLHEHSLTEGKEYLVQYTAPGNPDKILKTSIKGPKIHDAHDARRQFANDHYGMKLIAIKPAPLKKAVKKVEIEEHGPLGPRTSIDEGKVVKPSTWSKPTWPVEGESKKSATKGAPDAEVLKHFEKAKKLLADEDDLEDFKLSKNLGYEKTYHLDGQELTGHIIATRGASDELMFIKSAREDGRRTAVGKEKYFIIDTSQWQDGPDESEGEYY